MEQNREKQHFKFREEQSNYIKHLLPSKFAVHSIKKKQKHSTTQKDTNSTLNQRFFECFIFGFASKEEGRD